MEVQYNVIEHFTTENTNETIDNLNKKIAELIISKLSNKKEV
jgi:hypothetical protein